MREQIEMIRDRVKNRSVTYQEIVNKTGIKMSWLTKFSSGAVPGTSTKGLRYIERLQAFFNEK